jgi:hypothetical protein
MADNRTEAQIAADQAAEDEAAAAKAAEVAEKVRAEAAAENEKQAEKAKTEKFKYVGEMPEGQDTIEQHGSVFEFNKTTSVTKEAAAKLAGNPYFVAVK